MTPLRVISGKAKGKKLKSVPGKITRPITDRVKEALFNIIGADILSASFLDLFAGTGSVGIEALSRGADFVRFIDKHTSAIKTIKENLRITNIPQENYEVIQHDALKVLKEKPDRQFEYIYIAPPQYKEIWLDTLFRLDEAIHWLTEDGWVIVQIHPIEYKNVTLTHLVPFDIRDYGSTKLIFFRRDI